MPHLTLNNRISETQKFVTEYNSKAKKGNNRTRSPSSMSFLLNWNFSMASASLTLSECSLWSPHLHPLNWMNDSEKVYTLKEERRVGVEWERKRGRKRQEEGEGRRRSRERTVRRGRGRRIRKKTNKVYKYAQVRKQSIKFEAKWFNVFKFVLLAQLLSGIWLLVTLWTVAHQAPLSMGFSMDWSGLPFPSPGDFPNPGIELASPSLASWFFTTEPSGKPFLYVNKCLLLL